MKSFALLAVAGLATAASAQVTVSDVAINLSWDQAEIMVGETATATLTASWVGASSTYVSSVNIDMLASAALGTASNITAPWNNPAINYDGVGEASGADIFDFDASQFALFSPPPVQTGNPFVLGTFTFTATEVGTLSYSFENSELGEKFAFSIADSTLLIANPALYQSDIFTSDSLNIVVPAPSAMAMLGLGGLVATRRRR